MQLTELIKQIKEATNTVVSTSTVCRLLARFRFTRKKVQRVTLQQSVHLRATFVANTYIFSREMFVWVDETGCNYKDMLRRYGYALQSERAVSQTFTVRGQRVSSIAAICTEGILALESTINSVNGETFFDFAHGTLIPELLPFDGSNPKSIVIMDNCSIHHVQLC